MQASLVEKGAQRCSYYVIRFLSLVAQDRQDESM